MKRGEWVPLLIGVLFAAGIIVAAITGKRQGEEDCRRLLRRAHDAQDTLLVLASRPSCAGVVR